MVSDPHINHAATISVSCVATTAPRLNRLGFIGNSDAGQQATGIYLGQDDILPGTSDLLAANMSK